MSIANLLLRFVLELCAVAAAAYGGNHLAAAAGPLSWVAAVGAALAVILLWAVVVAPNTQNGLSQPQKDRIGTVIMLATAGVLALAGQTTLAIGFGALVVLNAALLVVLGRDALDQLKGVTQ